MALWTRVACRSRRWVPAVLISLATAACIGTSSKYPQSTLHPQSDFTRLMDGVLMNTVWAAIVVFILVEGALVWVVFRYRGKPDDPEPRQVHGNTTLEIIWTAIPALLLAIIAVPTVKAIFQTYDVPQDALTVEVIGHQWWWEFRYPDYGVRTADELHVPVGKMVLLKMKTEDVLHSFWSPEFAGKRDLFPNRTNTLWFTADTTGYFSGQCAEFCGTQHGRMGFEIKSTSPEEFDAYIQGLQATGPKAAADSAATAPAASGATQVSTLAAATQQLDPAERAAIDSGAKIFRMCSACHSLDATTTANMIGPNLANIASRRYIGARTLRNTPENLADWIYDPQAIKHGVIMPKLGLTHEQATMVAKYLQTHR